MVLLRRIDLDWFNSDEVDASLLHLILVLKGKNNLDDVITSTPETIARDVFIKTEKSRGTLQPGQV